MYTNFYQLEKNPFEISTNPAFLWLGEKHNEALAVLKYGVMGNRGFLLLTGDVGTGKTTLIHSLIEGLTDTVVAATVPDPGLIQLDFYRYIADAYGMSDRIVSKVDFLIQFKAFLKEADALGKRILLVIDEAQRMSLELLEEIRLLSNIETPQKKLLNIFFVGQNEFTEMLRDHRNRALRQRITIQYHIDPLNRDEVGEYIRHRLWVAGGRKELFSKDAIDRVHSYTMGFPRVINILCDHAMLTGFVGKNKIITPEIVDECAEELKLQPKEAKAVKTESSAESTPPQPETHQTQSTREPSKIRTLWPWTIAALLLAGIFIYLLTVIKAPSEKHAPKQNAQSSLTSTQKTVISVDASSMENKPSAGKPPVSETGVRLKSKPENIQPKNTEKVESNIIAPIPKPSPPVENPIPPPSESPEKFVEKDQISAPTESTIEVAPAPPKESIENTTVVPEKLEAPPAHQSQPHGQEAAIKEAPSNPRPTAAADPETFSTTVFFQVNSNAIPEDDYRQIDQVIQTLKQYPDKRLIVRGYSDMMGDPEYNRRLTQFRADTICSYLMGKGVTSERMRCQGMGSDLSKSKDPKIKRRVDVYIER
jgi:general secretion pathway protein A